MARPDLFVKDPSAVLDYKFDWRGDTNNNDPAADGDWLEAGETISTATVTAEAGLTIDADALSDTNSSVTVWLSGGTAGEVYTVTCEIQTSAARTDQRSIKIEVEDR